MLTFLDLKERERTSTPLLLFDCTLLDGSEYHWCTQRVEVKQTIYEPRVSRNNLFEMQIGSDQGVDTIPKLTLELANADSFVSELQRSAGFKGARLTCSFVFYDQLVKTALSEAMVLFQGVFNSPESITESTVRITAINRLSAQRVVLPFMRVQRRCAWNFPSTAQERAEAIVGGSKGEHSRFYGCGYSADQPDGVGNVQSGEVFTECSFTRADCEARGMFRKDARGQTTARFSGIEFVPSSITVRSAGERGTHASGVNVNEARYNDFVPMVYGTAWYTPSIVFARNDGNLTRMEVLLGVGEMQALHKVLVSDNEIPVGRSGQNMTGTGWFNVVHYGGRSGEFNRDFTDGSGAPLGDPYGGLALLSVVVPNRINDGKSLPEIKVLADGLKLARYDEDGSPLPKLFTNNPAWVLLDVLLRNGWGDGEIDFASFATTASYCDETIPARDLHNNEVQLPRFQCNLVLKSRKSAGDVLRGIRNGSRLFLTFGASGKLTLRGENTLALQQKQKSLLSNASTQLNGGWPAYEFGDGSNSFSGILKDANGHSSLKLSCRSASDTPNRYSVEFQDAFNEYQQDSFSLTDAADVFQAGQEINSAPAVLGLPNYHQAARTLQFLLNKSIAGNVHVEFQTSVRALGITPGDLISLTYLRQGFARQPFRVTKIAPGQNFRSATITAQIHDDNWYSDETIGSNGSGRRLLTANLGVPRPICGIQTNDTGGLDFAVTETSSVSLDGTASVLLAVEFETPPLIAPSAPPIPIVGLTPSFTETSGGLEGGQTVYYALTGIDEGGNEGALSFVVRASLPDDSNRHAVTLKPLSFSSSTTHFHVYRGTSPAQLNRIASDIIVAGQFRDSGLPLLPILPPDANFHHTTIYWRLESQGEANANLSSDLGVGNVDLRLTPNAYKGFAVRIVSGPGAGQERLITSNSQTSVAVSPQWEITPDPTSIFVISQAAFQVGSTGQGHRFQFEVPNHEGTVVQLLGRSANAAGGECPAEISPLTRWEIGGAGLRLVDAVVAPAPVFGLALSPGLNGTVILGGVGFAELQNTSSVVAGTLTLELQDELSDAARVTLVSPLSDTDQILRLNEPQPIKGNLIRIARELLSVENLNPDGTISVTRGVWNTTAGTYADGETVFCLKKMTTSVPFIRNFFGTPASGDWSYTISVPNSRICAAEFFVSNSQGNSPISAQSYTNTSDFGLRTLSGGQYSFQVAGPLAVEDNPVPEVVLEVDHVIGDIRAFLTEAPIGTAVEIGVLLNSETLCTLLFDPGSSSSTLLNGADLPALRRGDRLGIEILAVGSTLPGAELTVLVKI